MPLFHSFESKINFLTFAPIAAALLSLVGSVLTIIMIARTRIYAKGLSTFHRLLLGICIPDMISSLGISLGPLPAPPLDELPFPGRNGTTASCTFQGFLLQIGLMSFGYTNMLMIYYILVIRYNIPDETISKRIEPFLHAIPLAFHGISSVAGLFLGVYGPQFSFCFVGGSPFGCDENPEIECERGSAETIDFFGTWFTTVPTILWTLILVVLLSIIVWTVLRKYYASRRFAPADPSTGVRATSNAFSKSTRIVVTQCILYGVTFINVSVWGTIPTMLSLVFDINTDSLGKHFWLSALGVFFYPIQGLFNFLIYMRPRYLSFRETYPETGRWFAIKETIWYPAADQDERQERSTMHNESRSRQGTSKASSSKKHSDNQSGSSGGVGSRAVLSQSRQHSGQQEGSSTVEEQAYQGVQSDEGTIHTAQEAAL